MGPETRAAFELRSLSRKRNWVERRKGKVDQLSFLKTACFINNPLFGSQTQSGQSRVSFSLSNRMHSLTHSPTLLHIRKSIFHWGPGPPYGPHAPPIPVPFRSFFLIAVILFLFQLSAAFGISTPNRSLTHTYVRSCHAVMIKNL